MDKSIGQNLLIDLKSDPELFFNSKDMGYSLLNEYKKGFDISTLIEVLGSEISFEYRIGISIASELSFQNCAYLLPELVDLLGKESDSLYLHYLLEAIFKGTFDQNYHEFVFVVLKIEDVNVKVIDTVMNLLMRANYQQLKGSLDRFYSENYLNNNLLKCLNDLYCYRELEIEVIKEMIISEDQLTRLFSGVISAKLFLQNSDLISICSKSSDIILRDFAETFIYINT